MRLLLTRAAEDSARTREKLVAAGHRVIVSPLIEIVSTGAAWPAGTTDALLATSRQAFATALDGLTPEARRLVPLYLVGQRTAEAARRSGYLGAATVEPNAAALVEMMRRLVLRPRRVVYLAGRDRKPDIETALHDIGQPLEVVETYEARATGGLTAEAEKALQLAMLDGVLHFSRRSAALFVTATAALALYPSAMRQFCLSQDVAAPLQEAGWGAIRIARSPSEADLLASVGEP